MSSLEEGDFFPFIKIALTEGGHFDLMNCTTPLPFVFVTVKDFSTLTPFLPQLQTFARQAHVTVYHQTWPGAKTHTGGVRLTSSSEVASLLGTRDDGKATIYLVTPNRRIYQVSELDEWLSKQEIGIVNEGSELLTVPKHETNIPYLLIENVFDPPLLERIIKFYRDNESKAILHNTANKNRLHVHPDQALERAIDNKLSRSVFPEVRKVFYFDIKFRESYKISSYNAGSNGRFSGHRDTPHPYGHRRYAMSLCLNDDYEGGEFKLNEYGLSVKLRKNCALIFPGICSHEVAPITKGSRMVIITFFTNKETDAYRVKSDFFKERELTESQIYPT